MSDPPVPASVVEAAGVGLPMPILLIGLPRVVDLSGIGDLVVYAWLVCLAALTAGVGLWRAIPTGSLLAGTSIGTIVGWVVIASTVGFDFVLLMLALFSLLAVIAGGGIAYEWRRAWGEPREPPRGTWRLVFVSILAVIAVVTVMAFRGPA